MSSSNSAGNGEPESRDNESGEAVEDGGGPWSEGGESKSADKEKSGSARPRREGAGRFLRRLRNVVILLLILAGIGAVAWYQYRDQLPPSLGGTGAPVLSPQSDIAPGRLDDLEGRISMVEAREPAEIAPLMDRIDELEQQIAAYREAVETGEGGAGEGGAGATDLTPVISRLEALTERITAVDERVAALEAKLRTTAAQQVSPADLAAVQERLNTLTDALSDNAALIQRTRNQLSELQSADIYKAESMMLSLATARVRQSVEAGQPFAASLDALAELARSGGSVPIAVQDALDALRPHAEEGVSSERALAESFRDAASRIVNAADVPEDGNWWDRTLANLRDVVSVRRVGDVEGDNVEAVVARAEQAVEGGRISKAVTELETLQGEAREAASPWIGAAQDRLTALEALDKLNGRLTTKEED